MGDPPYGHVAGTGRAPGCILAPIAPRRYIARRTAEGKTPRAGRRALKRYITRELYRALTATMTLTTYGTVQVN